MIPVTSRFSLNELEIEFSFIRSAGPGGQNVNKVATAVQLRFNVQYSTSIPETIRARLLLVLHSKITSEGDIIIKANRYRTQERNKQDALDRLIELLKSASIVPKKRKKTKPTQASKQRRLETKKRHGKIKSLRQKKSNLEA